ALRQRLAAGFPPARRLRRARRTPASRRGRPQTRLQRERERVVRSRPYARRRERTAADVNRGGTRMTAEPASESKGVFVFGLRLKPGTQEAFLKAYEAIRYEVARGVRGHLMDQVCQAPEDPEAWLITSEWETLDHFLDWERTQEPRDLVKPMRDCFAEARSLKYVVREETSAGSSI